MTRGEGVSVIVAFYNQAVYVEQTLNSILNQKTGFEFEVLVHDDASTDGTKEIIERYAIMYPDKIVTFFEDTNQNANTEQWCSRILYNAKGKYFATCDGDDYWIDDHKLQMQFDFMEANTDFSLCTHNSLIIDTITGKEQIAFQRKTKELPREEVIEKACSQFCSGSHFIRLEPWYKKHGKILSDLGRVLWSADAGRIMYLEDVMSVYRVHTKGSWSASIKNEYTYIIDLMNRIVYYKKFNDSTNGRWTKSINSICDQIICEVFSQMRQDYRNLRFKNRTFILLTIILDYVRIWPLTLKNRNYMYKKVKK